MATRPNRPGRAAGEGGSHVGYAAWHPSGKILAYSIMKVRQFFHSASDEVRDVVDLDSLMVER